MKSLILKYNWLCLATICCALFAACEPAEVTTDKNAIAFKNGQNRAIADNEDNARVFAYRTTTDAENIATTEWLCGTATQGAKAKIYAETADGVTVDKIEIEQGETKYWTNATYSFLSVYSTSRVAKGVEPQLVDNKLTFPYNIGNDMTSSANEIWVAAKLNEVHTASETNPVQFEFDHILSKINFNIKKHSSNNEDKIVVTKVTISEIYNSGVYSLDVTNNSADWTFRTEGDTKDELLENIEFTATASSGVLTTAGTKVLGDYGFLTIPQPIKANTVQIVISYNFYDKSDTSTLAYSKEVKAFLPISVVNEWEIGKNYTYNLLLSAETNDIVFTTPTISDWGASSVGSIIIQ